MAEKLVVKNLYKIFGSKPETALELLHQGLEKDEIFKRTGHVVGVQDASFSVNAGEIFVVMGLSGSGKSTLVRMLNRLIDPTAGNILVDGEDVAQLSKQKLIELRRRNMSMVFQSFALMPHLTVLENAAFGLEIAGVDQGNRERRALAALERVGLAANARSYPDQLSGGMQQRVGLARALATDPSVMLMDEAFSALDPLIRTEMQDELLRLQTEQQRTIVFISHDLDEALRIGDRIAIMRGGRVVQVGTASEILRNPADDYVRSFFHGVDITHFLTAEDLAADGELKVVERSGPARDLLKETLRRMRESDQEFAYVENAEGRFVGVVSVNSVLGAIETDQPKFSAALLSSVEAVPNHTHLDEVLTKVAESHCPLPVVNDNRVYVGTVSKSALLQKLRESR